MCKESCFPKGKLSTAARTSVCDNLPWASPPRAGVDPAQSLWSCHDELGHICRDNGVALTSLSTPSLRRLVTLSSVL